MHSMWRARANIEHTHRALDGTDPWRPARRERLINLVSRVA